TEPTVSRQSLASLGTVCQRAILGDGARGLQPRRQRLDLLSPRSCPVARLSLGRGRSGGVVRSLSTPGLRPGIVARPRSHSEGTSLRPDSRGNQPRRRCQGILLLPRCHSDSFLSEISL